jgi:hypothetical protein
MQGSKSSLKSEINEDFYGVSIVDAATGKYVAVLRVVMQLAYPKGHLPELFEVFGKENLLQFLDIFAGTTIKVPPQEALEHCMRDVVIYLRLHTIPPSHRPKIVRAIAKKYQTTSGDVRSTFVRIEKAFKELDLKIK